MRVHQLEEGAEVLEIVPASPADEAGLRAGDLILAVDDDKVTSRTPLAVLIADHEPDDTVTLTVERDGQKWETDVQLGGWSVLEEPETTWEG